jgi:hypothetical protein
MTAAYANPFHTWADLAQRLRDRFVAELGDHERTPYRDSLLGGLAGLVRQCEHARTLLQDVETHVRKAFEAFRRAMEKS